MEADDPELPEMSLKKQDFEYGVQYFNKFKKLGYRINELTYHIFEHEVISTLCPPSEKNRYQRILENSLNFAFLKNSASDVMYVMYFQD